MSDAAISQSSRETFCACSAQDAFAQQKNEHEFDIMSQENKSGKQLNPIAVADSLAW